MSFLRRLIEEIVGQGPFSPTPAEGMKKFLFVGLGNPGEQYAGTRHNVGFMVLDALASRHSLQFKTGKHGLLAEYSLKGNRITLLKPTTYMNLSGQAVRYWLQQLKAEPGALLVVTDDLALPYGAMRMRGKGSGGGHNGLGNIQEVLATQEYARLRFGVGNNYAKGLQVEYVLNPFSKEEQAMLAEKVTAAANAMEAFCLEGLEKAMSAHNTKGE